MTLDELIAKHPKFNFLRTAPEFTTLSPEQKDFVLGLIEDAIFWVEVERKPNHLDGFKFIAASYGLENARTEADSKKLEGKEREKFLKPHQELYTMFNPYSGNSNAREN